jgi:RNA polymerase sigma-70 factor (ECF subfamily)
MLLLNNQTNQINGSRTILRNRTILQRLAQSDKTAIQDCVDTYGNLIWALAKTKTASLEEAENLTLKIFMDVWKYSERYNLDICDEITFISVIAHRRFIVH